MASLDVLQGASPSDVPSALAVLAGSLYLPDIAATINLAVACGHPALLAAACRAIDRIVGQQPAATPEQILALMTAAITIEGALSKQRPTAIQHQTSAPHGSARSRRWWRATRVRLPQIFGVRHWRRLCR